MGAGHPAPSEAYAYRTPACRATNAGYAARCVASSIPAAWKPAVMLLPMAT
jgi:hypothetical protein